MKIILLLGVFLFLNEIVFGQDLQGEWKGYFTELSTAGETAISFTFIKKNDSVFTATSKTFLKPFTYRDTAVSILSGGFLKKNILYLEESKNLKPFSGAGVVTCLQLMKLRYYKTKKELVLHGTWFTETENCGSGRIHLTKKLK
ncbi:hypothetical protein [Ferruginibacter sp.]